MRKLLVSDKIYRAAAAVLVAASIGANSFALDAANVSSETEFIRRSEAIVEELPKSSSLQTVQSVVSRLARENGVDISNPKALMDRFVMSGVVSQDQARLAFAFAQKIRAGQINIKTTTLAEGQMQALDGVKFAFLGIDDVTWAIVGVCIIVYALIYLFSDHKAQERRSQYMHMLPVD